MCALRRIVCSSSKLGRKGLPSPTRPFGLCTEAKDVHRFYQRRGHGEKSREGIRSKAKGKRQSPSNEWRASYEKFVVETRWGMDRIGRVHLQHTLVQQQEKDDVESGAWLKEKDAKSELQSFQFLEFL